MNSVAPDGRRVNVMIASTKEDLGLYRKEASRILKEVLSSRQMWYRETSMERKRPDGDAMQPVETSKHWVDEADWVVLIVGFTYGHVSGESGAGDLSVTHWEYLHARDQENKKIFVFVVDESPGGYRPVAREEKSLREWGMDQTDAQKAALARFRKELYSGPGSRFVLSFTDVEDFCRKLHETISKELDSTGYSLAPVLLPLLLSVRPSFQCCIDEVKLLARYKRIHDELHDLRQTVIRPILETALPQWEEKPDSPEALVLIGNKSGVAEGVVRHFAKDARDLKSTRPVLATELRTLTDLVPLWGGRTEAGRFRGKVERFARAVQRVFTLSDTAMRDASHALDQLYIDFVTEVGLAKSKKSLNPADDKKLAVELSKLERNKQRLLDVMEFHHRWQEQYDQLLMLGNARETEYFTDDLKEQKRGFRERLLPLAQEDVGKLVPVNPDSLLSTALPRLGDLVGELVELPCVKHFVRMHKTFEDVFYQIDKGVLSEVEASEARVRDLERHLETLAQQEMHANG